MQNHEREEGPTGCKHCIALYLEDKEEKTSKISQAGDKLFGWKASSTTLLGR